MTPSPRAKWLIWRTFAFLGLALGVMVLGSMIARLLPAAAYPLAWGSASSLGLLMLAWQFAVRSGWSPASIGLGWSPRTPRRFVAGLAIGALTYATTLAIDAALFGPIRFSPANDISLSALALTLAGLAAAITMEELAFRSYALHSAVHAIGSLPGQALVALAFAALHLIYGWPLPTVLMGVLPSAVLYGVCAMVSRGLALPLGVHLGQVAARTLGGEGDQQVAFVMDTSALDPAAGAYAPLVGAAIPLIAAGLILLARCRMP